MTEQIDDYFARQRLVALIREKLQSRIDNLDMKLFLVENKAEFGDFVGSQKATQKAVETEIKSWIKHVLDAQFRFNFSNKLFQIFSKISFFKQYVVRGT